MHSGGVHIIIVKNPGVERGGGGGGGGIDKF